MYNTYKISMRHNSRQQTTTTTLKQNKNRWRLKEKQCKQKCIFIRRGYLSAHGVFAIIYHTYIPIPWIVCHHHRANCSYIFFLCAVLFLPLLVQFCLFGLAEQPNKFSNRWLRWKNLHYSWLQESFIPIANRQSNLQGIQFRFVFSIYLFEKQKNHITWRVLY